MEQNKDVFNTIIRVSEGVFRDKGSKFLGYAFPIYKEEEVKQHLQKLKLEHPKARHWCWAMRISPDRQIYRFSDDGEPAGSAGRPILNVLLSQDITNVLVVVVRYFGGTLLGVPGLINAYKTATQEALVTNSIIQKSVLGKYSIFFNYLGLNEIMKIIKAHNIYIESQNFDNLCEMIVLLPKSESNEIVSKINKVDQVEVQFIDWM